MLVKEIQTTQTYEALFSDKFSEEDSEQLIEEYMKNIVKLCFGLSVLRKKVCNKVANINATVSWFVPKAHTPFGWQGQQAEEYFRNPLFAGESS